MDENLRKELNKLPNNGMATKKRVFSKKIKIGVTKDECKNDVYLEYEIKHIDLSTEAVFNQEKILRNYNTKETIDHKKIKEYYTLSICGSSKHFFGQIVESLNTEEIDIINKEKLDKIKKIWNEWHLNDLQPNCIHQKSFDCNCEYYQKKAEKESSQCPEGYKYGSKWLIKELPQEVINEVIHLFNTYNEE